MKPDVIGKIVLKQPIYDKETGEIIEHGVYTDDYHVNFVNEVDGLEDYLCDPQPSTPYRVYQGGIKPVCYRFDTKEQWEYLNPFKNENLNDTGI